MRLRDLRFGQHPPRPALERVAGRGRDQALAAPRARDLSELLVGNIMVRAAPLRVVERVERLQPHLQPHLFTDFKILEDGHVPVIDSRPAQDIPA